MPLKTFFTIVCIWTLLWGAGSYNAAKFFSAYENQNLLSKRSSLLAQAILEEEESLKNIPLAGPLQAIAEEKKVSKAKAPVFPLGKEVVQKTPSAAPAAKVSTASKPVAAVKSQTPQIISLNSFLNATKAITKQRADGSYWVQLSADIGSAKPFTWDPTESSIGGTGTVPQMGASFTCNPQYDNLGADGLFSPLSFKTNTSYACDLTLSDKNGRVGTKQLTFKTGQGLLTVSRATGMLDNSNLHDGNIIRGITFQNSDDAPVTITGFTFDLSFEWLDTSSPAALRFLNGDTLITSIPFSTVPKDTSSTSTNAYAQNNIPMGLSLTIPPHSGKMLSVQGFGINKIGIGTYPSLSVSIRGITTNRTDLPARPDSIAIKWYCIPMSITSDPASLIPGPMTCSN